MSHLILERLWSASWQGAIAILLALLVVRLARRLPAHIHCWVWRLAAAKMLIVLAGLSLVPLPIVPEQRSSSTSLSAATFSQAGEAADVAVVTEVNDQVTAPLEHKPPDGVAQLALPSWVTWIAISWGIGVAVQLARIARHWLQVRRLLCATQLVDEPRVLRLLRREALLMKLSRCPELLTGAARFGPALVGPFRPQVFLPQELVDHFDPHRLRLVLRHELAHLQRGDLWWNWLATATHVLFFFHPLVWLLQREWKLSQELACDAITIDHGRGNCGDYARLLLDFALETRPMPLPVSAVGVFESFGTMKRRMEAMNDLRTAPPRRARVAMIILTIVVAVGLCPWKLAPMSGGQPAVADSPRTKAPAATTKGGKYEISLVDLVDVSKMQARIANSYGKKFEGNINATADGEQVRREDGNSAVAGGGVAAGGGATNMARFNESPQMALVLGVAPLKGTHEVIVDKLIATDTAGNNYESIPHQGISRLACPDLEREHPGSAVAYFTSSQLPSEFASLSGSLIITPVRVTEAEFTGGDLETGAKVATEQGPVSLDVFDVALDGVKIEITIPESEDPHPLPPRGEFDPEVLQQAMRARLERQMRGMGALAVELVDTEGTIHRPKTSTSGGGTTVTRSSSEQTNNGQGTTARSSGGIASNTEHHSYEFAPLPEGVAIEAVRIRRTEKSDKPSRTVPFKFESVSLE